MEQSETEFPTLNLFLNWMIDNHGYASILIGFFMAFWVKLFFRKSGHNLFEIFVLNCYISGISSLIFSVALIFQGLFHLNLINFSIFIVLVYYTWTTGHFFDKRQGVNYIKAFFSYVLSITTLSFLLTFVGIFIDIIIKQ
jgi:hypothetical protein